jgi:hypothetical protein
VAVSVAGEKLSHALRGKKKLEKQTVTEEFDAVDKIGLQNLVQGPTLTWPTPSSISAYGVLSARTALPLHAGISIAAGAAP